MRLSVAFFLVVSLAVLSFTACNNTTKKSQSTIGIDFDEGLLSEPSFDDVIYSKMDVPRLPTITIDTIFPCKPCRTGDPVGIDCLPCVYKHDPTHGIMVEDPEPTGGDPPLDFRLGLFYQSLDKKINFTYYDQDYDQILKGYKKADIDPRIIDSNSFEVGNSQSTYHRFVRTKNNHVIRFGYSDEGLFDKYIRPVSIRQK